MRTIADVRDARLRELRLMIERPGIWALDGRAMQGLAQQTLRDLCFIDDRDDAYSHGCEALSCYGKLGVWGAFSAVFGDECTYTEEVVSVLAQVAAGLGYVELDRRLTEPEWRSLLAEVRDNYEEVDVRLSQT
jgi:hypothetical protein